ncbi:hypothetical protein M0805_002667 [Coniferiporia weirii]|nr:hypothetical protein M0805_002667 [Coniferiporia weirii]
MLLLAIAACVALVEAVAVTDIQGNAFVSPLKGESVKNVTGIVTAKGPDGFWIAGPKVDDDSVSNGLNVFTDSKTIQNQVAVGDMISLSGVVSEFRSSSDPDNLLGTELDSPSDIVVISSGNEVVPVVLGVDRSPPTEKLSSLDKGQDGFLAVPNNQSLVDVANPLVNVKSPIVTDFENSFGEIFVYGDWPVTGKNSRGGITMTFASDGTPDGNPETVIIGAPLDGTSNPSVAVGQTLSDITGVILYQFGFFYVMPTTAPKVISSPDFTVPATTITSSSSDPCVVTIGDYNVDNMAPTSTTLPTVAQHIATKLNSPDFLFVQEIQDNSGPTDDGVVIANVTMQTIADAVVKAGGAQYSFLEIPPVNDMDGGEPGGNIRQVYFYRADKFKLAGDSSIGGSTNATAIIVDDSGQLGLSLNPGRIDPTNSAWDSSRKPLAAVWESVLPESTGQRFFTVNLHLIAKTGSTTVQGNARPPVNLGVDQRTSQVEIVASFVNSILSKDANASVIVGGDCNEFIMARSVFASFDGILTDVDEVAGIEDVERYTYVFDQNNEQLDHLFVSGAIANRGVEVEHIHVNNWASDISLRASDHDPSVAKLQVC